MITILSLSSVGCGKLGRTLETYFESCPCRLLVYVLWMSLRLHGFTSLRCCEWIGYRFDIIFCSGSFLVYMWQVLLLRLVIAGYRLDMFMIWDSLVIPFGVWIVGWVLALVVGAISAMDILTTTDTCDYLWINVFVLDISVGTRFYDLLMQQVGWLSLWMASMYVQW